MAEQLLMTGSVTGAAQPVVRKISLADLRDVLAKGIADFWATPTQLVFLCLIYPVVGLVAARAALGYYEILPLLFPLVSGFALIGPFAAIGLYEISRRRERGLDASWSNAFDVLLAPAIGSIVGLGALLLAIFAFWLGAAHTIYLVVFGNEVPASAGDFVYQVLATRAGWTLIVVGTGVGFLFAALVLVLTVVSFPLLIDRPVGAAVAVQTSIRAVRENPVTMAAWGLIVAASLVIGCLPLFVGLSVVLPVLGHATWHLYRKVVVS